MTIEALRTPEARFRDLPDFPFEPRFAEVGDGLRMAYVDEGPQRGAASDGVVLMLHGEPSWSFLYRFMIPVCAAEHRVVAPDLIGFGRSDKPVRLGDYSYRAHVDWMLAFLEALDLRAITLVCQDWGSLIGLRLAAEHPDRFARIVVGNGGLPTGDRPLPRAFHVWRAFARYSPWFPIGRIVDAGTRRALSAAERRAYDAPFPSSRHKAGARAFPNLVPTSPRDPAAAANRAAWEALGRWDKPFLTAFSNGDPITRGGDRVLQKHVPGAAGQDHATLRGGHFLQEDDGPRFAEAVNRFVATA